MVAGVAAAMVISVVATCVGSLYYCNKPKEYLKKVSGKICDDVNEECVDSTEKGSRVRVRKENRTEKGSKNTPLSVLKVQQDDVSDKFISERANGERTTSSEWTRGTIFPSKITNVVPVRPPRRRREISQTAEDSSGRFSSTESRRSSTKNGATDASHVADCGHGVKTVKAQIEYHPREISSLDKKISNSRESESSMNVVNSMTEESTLKASGEGSNVTSLNTKNDRSGKVKTRKTINAIAQRENDKTEGLNPIVPSRSSSENPSCADRSIMFQINRMVNASTSTKISSHAHELKEFGSEQIASVQEIWKRSSCDSEEYGITILREVLSFLSHEGKDCALELSTSRTRNDENGESNTSRDNDSGIINIQIRTYHRMSGGYREKSKSSLMKMYGKLSGRLETNKERSSLSSKESSRTRLSSMDSTYSLSSTDKSSSYYTIRLSEVDRAIFDKKNKKKEKLSKMNRVKKVFQCQNWV